MRCLAAAFLVFFTSCSNPRPVLLSPQSIAPEVKEMGFETEKIATNSPGWFVSAAGWSAELSEEKFVAGKRAAKLFLPGESTAPFGNLMQTLPAAELAGRHIKLSAKILVVGEGRGQMWLRVDRVDKRMGAFDNMGDRPILAGDWKEALIEADIDPDAMSLNIGFMSIGGATLFIDDVKMQLSGDRRTLQQPSPARALSEREIENLTAAAKLLSYVRFFHPTDAAVSVASWDDFAVDLMQSVEAAADATDLAKRLGVAFAAIAPTVEIWPGTPAQAPPLRPNPQEATQVAMWEHFGAGKIASPRPQPIYHSEVKKLPIASLTGEPKVVVKNLGGGVSCRVPIAVFADEAGTLPHAKTPDRWASSAGSPKLSALNRSTRLAGVALGWGVFQHFYPYFDVVETDWDAALPAALSKAATDADETAYWYTLREMVARLHDGHGRVMNSSLPAASRLPLDVRWAGEDLVVVGKQAHVPDSVTVGDAIVSIDGRPIESCYVEVSKWISAASDGWCRYVSQRALVTDLPTKDPALLVLRKPDGETQSVELARVKGEIQVTGTGIAKRPEGGAELAPGIVYFDLVGAETEALTEAMPKLTAAKAILFDLRGYPGSAAHELMRHLIDAPATSARWCIPIVRLPDHEGFEWPELGRWQLDPQEPRLAAEIAFVTDGSAISYAESIMGIVENYKFGEIIGSTTAGTNGNVNPFLLPGGYQLSWTGMKVLKHDGSQHHGIGIAPTVPVVPTAKGIAAGRDEVLEKAVAVMQAKIATPVQR